MVCFYPCQFGNIKVSYFVTTTEVLSLKGSINGFINIMMELKKSCNHCCLVRQYDQIEEDSQSRLQVVYALEFPNFSHFSNFSSHPEN